MGIQKDAKEIPFGTAILTFVLYGVAILMAIIVEMGSRIIWPSQNKPPKGYAELIPWFSTFYTHRMYRRISDCWNRPICSGAGAYIDLVERVGLENEMRETGRSLHCMNLGSYNYLGFGNDNVGNIKGKVVETLKEFGVAPCGARAFGGNSSILVETERLMASFLGKEDAIIFPMGYNTNATCLSSFIAKGDLVLSDTLNHASIVIGLKGAPAAVRCFRHNDPVALEATLRQAIAEGQPRTHRPWKRIFIVVEGIYSMEGEILRLPEFVALKKKYKCYLYIDEAHSIGALGRTGRGVCDHFNIPTSDVDILMGTFTKSFAAVGGYITSSKAFIDVIRARSMSVFADSSMSAGCLRQIQETLNIIMGTDGTSEGQRRINALRDNSNYLREQLGRVGFQVLGDADSPVIPLMIYHPTKIPAFSRECLKEGLATVVVGFPAVPSLLGRARLCCSAAHNKEDLNFAIDVMTRVGEKCMLLYDQPK